jgi:hypothetical protein
MFVRGMREGEVLQTDTLRKCWDTAGVCRP